MPDTRPKVLAIDDMPTNLFVLASGLSNEFNLQIATSGAAGIAIARTDPPELILLDVMMPEMDGYETFRKLRADPALRAIPVIFASALTDTGSELKGLELGADDYLHKPIIVAIARQRIRNLIERQALRRQVERHRTELQDLVEERTRELVDITRRLRVAKGAAEAASRGKTAFLASMSFELRSKLSVIIGLSELQQRNLLDPDLLGRSRRIIDAGRELLQKFEDMIQISAMERAIGLSDGVEFPLAPLLQRVEVSMRARAAAKGIVLESTIEGQVPARWCGPSALLIQLLENLVGDAIVNAEPGSIRIVVSMLSRKDDTACLRFDVIAAQPPALLPTQGQEEPGHGRPSDGLITALYSEPDSIAAFNLELAQLLGGEVGIVDRPAPAGRRWATACLKVLETDTHPAPSHP
jgi:DNA-binding response OmpR family regulator